MAKSKQGITKGGELWKQPPTKAKPQAQGHARKSPMPGHKHNDGPVSKGPEIGIPLGEVSQLRSIRKSGAHPQPSTKAKTASRVMGKLEDGTKFAAKPKVSKGDKKR